MSSKMDPSEKDSMEAALDNHVVLRNIFSLLPLRDLKTCRLLNKFWSSEVASYIADNRRCNVRISMKSPCEDLNTLDELISKITVVPIINSLTLILLGLSPQSHLNCTENTCESYDALLNKLPLKYVVINERLSCKPSKCPAIEFAFQLLREKLTDLHELRLDFYDEKYFDFLRDTRIPVLPKLRVFRVSGIWYKESDSFLRIVNAAPNLKKIVGQFGCEITDVVPEDRYAIMGNVSLCIDSDEQYRKFVKIAKARPALSHLSFGAPSESSRSYMNRFLDLLEQLLTSSCETLQSLFLEKEHFPLSYLTFPRLSKLKTVNITMERGSSDHFNNVLRSVDFRKLPNLQEVYLFNKANNGDDAELPTHHWITNYAVPPDFSPSYTVELIKLHPNLLAIKELGKIFPNLQTLTVERGWTENFPTIQYADLWACWPHLETVELIEGEGVMNSNFDAEFLGISPEELSLLKEMDDEALEKIHIVPIRPSILTMSRLQSLKIRLHTGRRSLHVPDSEERFLSRVTGILALRKLVRKGVKVKFVDLNTFDKVARGLTHLYPYASARNRDEYE